MTESEHLEDVCRWLRFASEDMAVAEDLQRVGGVARVRCFHAQQAAEKAIKSVLVHLQVDFEKTHDLMTLLLLLPQDWALSSEPGELPELSIWAVKGRYPGDWPEATEADANRAVATSRAIVGQVLDHFARRGILP